MDAMSDEILEKIKLRSAAATPGPWTSLVEGRDHSSGSNFIMIGDDENRGDDIELTGASIADQDFIACARQDIPMLLNEIVRLRSLCESKV